MRILAVCLVMMSGCYSTPQPDCGFVCGPLGECPEGYQCASDQRCHRVGAPASLMCESPPDARVPRDAAPDAELDAPDAADMTPPTVFATVPTNATTDVSRTTTITVTFDEAVTGVNTTTFTVAIGGTAVTGTITAQSTSTYIFTPDAMLTANATVTVSLDGAITDIAGNALAATTFSFQTGA